MSAHDHAHSHAPGHAHSHAPASIALPGNAAPGLSLLRMSLAGRLAIAGGFVTLIWIAVYWALR